MAFTLIELLVVILIIAILLSLILVGASAIRKRSKVALAESIVGSLQLALKQNDAASGSSAAPVEHPLAGSGFLADFPAAGSDAPRARFQRAGGGAVATVGEALVIDDPARMVSDQERAVLGDDRFEGQVVAGDLPLLYGVERRHIGILGATCDWISGHRRLPPRGAGYDDAAGKLKAPYDATVYADATFRYRTTLPPRTLLDDAMTATVTYAIGSKRSQFEDLGAIASSAPPRAEADGGTWIGSARDMDQPSRGSWDPYHRVWLPPAAEAGEVDPGRFTPGTMRLGGTWQRYRLRGTALYDPWGSEILYLLSDTGAVRIVSAGEDGVLRFHPGPDGSFETLPTDEVAADSDRDGVLDNIGFKDGG